MTQSTVKTMIKNYSLKGFIVFFLVMQTLTRGILSFLQNDSLSWIDISFVFGIGFLCDLSVLCFFLLLPTLYITLFSKGFHQNPVHSIIRKTTLFLFIYIIFFTAIAEIVFWEEFTARFNFIAVDYLIYTTEVLRNLHESYNMPLLLGGIFLCSSATFYLLSRHQQLSTSSTLCTSWKARLIHMTSILCLTFICYSAVPSSSFIHGCFSSQNHRELAQNGIFSLFSAFFNNSLNYEQFYLTPEDFEKKTGHSPLENAVLPPKTNAISILNKNASDPFNIILVLMESMSAEFMATFGNQENLTPCLDRLVQESISFKRMYATGTRTVRGIEAITLAIPPSPGQSIVKRPGNEGLNAMGKIFRDQGYQTAFIYGGNSYFDNMEHFFESNGFDIIDRSHFTDKDIAHENAWGVCDEDLFQKVIAEGDKAFAHKKPFMFFALTTSNHRPYTYPTGKIDLAPKVTGRSGGVKYADFAIGELVRHAKTRPWFSNTIFVFVADHTHGTTGRLEITPEKHHIPCLFYAPFILAPRTIDSMVSQIDILPTLLNIANIPYKSAFGTDMLNNQPDRAFISNFQKIGYLTHDKTTLKDHLTVLKPVKDVSCYDQDQPVQNPDEQEYWQHHIGDAIRYFSTASHWEKILR